MKDIRTIRRTVATMANQLHKLGYSLSQAFKTAWKRIKEGMTEPPNGFKVRFAYPKVLSYRSSRK